MEAGFQGHLCLAENRSLLIDSSVRFGVVFGSHWMGEEMESKGAMDGYEFEPRWEMGGRGREITGGIGGGRA